MKKFEYKEEKDCYPNDLKRLGLEGWELCGIYVSGMRYVFVFKREIVEGENSTIHPMANSL